MNRQYHKFRLLGSCYRNTLPNARPVTLLRVIPSPVNQRWSRIYSDLRCARKAQLHRQWGVFTAHPPKKLAVIIQ